MKKNNILILVTLLIAFVFNTSAAEEIINKTYKPYKNINIRTVKGDCKIIKSNCNEINIKVRYTYSDDSVKFIFKEKKGVLYIEEKFLFQEVNGKAGWIISIPENTNINFISGFGDFIINDLSCEVFSQTGSGIIKAHHLNGKINFGTSSGDLNIENVCGEISINSTSGNIKVKEISGKIYIGEASGDINIENIKGSITVNSANSTINAKNVIIEGESLFSNGVGNINVILAESLKYNITLSSTTGSAILHLNDNALNGCVEMTAQKQTGKIICPFEFEKEKETVNENVEFITKSFTINNTEPLIKIQTANGKAILRK